MQKQPDLVWGMIASMWIGNLMLIIINLPLVGIWVRLLRVPYRLMFPSIVVFCAIGIYSINNAPVDVILAGAFVLLICVLTLMGSLISDILLAIADPRIRLE